MPDSFTMADEEIVLVTQLPSDSWFEGFVLRPNGNILATRLDKPELYTFDAEDPDATPHLLHHLELCNGLINIIELPGRPDEYHILSGNIDLEKGTCKDCLLWHAVLSQDDSSPPKLTQIAEVKDAGFAMGIVAVTDRVMLIADSGKGCVWHLDTETGKMSQFVADDTMMPPTEADFFGLNRIRVVGDYLWFTNTSAGTLYRIPVEMDTAQPEVAIRATGPVQKVLGDLPHLDGLALTKDQTRAYTVSMADGQLLEIKVDPATGQGSVEVITTSLDSPTGVELVYVNGRPKLYVVCCGEIDMAWIPKIDENPWASMDFNSNVVGTVTSEVVTVTQM
ncbi:Uu.00g123280.m01.CDS01 [Anthostomella pinea]|uniref:Uu.00g123280.m01.CDS01 n=1 Tax=Anthostomella pinea TaxID=933095 RepID=A0AAI8YHH0_9PEZI|nr:Uu.00g123280.m01.CDS01 [Anthostomella pinea]